MRILTTRQIRELDAYTIRHEPILSIDLMERASRAFVDWFATRVDNTRKIGVVCGTGNNGGDGLAIARMLVAWSYDVRVWIVTGGSETEDFKTNRSRLPEQVDRQDIKVAEQISFEGCEVLIDALFGSGLSRPVSGLHEQVIDRINESDTLRIAVDIPSGLMADAHSSGAIVKAHYTVTFQLPKLAFLLPETFPYTGDWVVVNIGLSKAFLKECQTSYYYARIGYVRKILRSRSKFDHKGTFGHALLIAGSYGKMGAAILAARAALRAGAGLVSAHVPEAGYPVMQTAVPEAMCHIDDDPHVFTKPPELSYYDVVGIGPGLGQDSRTKKALAAVLETYRRPVVLDADALNILAADRHLLALIPPGSILTPHPKEFERLTGPWSDDFKRLEMQKQLAVSLESVVVLKGAHTAVATPAGDVYFNATGNPGMATGGTGDVLTGVITGLLAQNYTPVEAAVSGVFLHGLAGDVALSEYGMDSMVASDLINHLPAAFLRAHRK